VRKGREIFFGKCESTHRSKAIHMPKAGLLVRKE
jgi:hypothetical protein